MSCIEDLRVAVGVTTATKLTSATCLDGNAVCLSLGPPFEWLVLASKLALAWTPPAHAFQA